MRSVLRLGVLALCAVSCRTGPPWPRVAVPVPVTAVAPGSRGLVAVDLDVAADGSVRKARAVDGDLPALGREVEAAALRWRFAPASAPHRTRICFRFRAVPSALAPGSRFRPPAEMEMLVPE